VLKQQRALLLSGGVGDFLHYIARISSYLSKTGLAPGDVKVFVEATRPAQVRRLFHLSMPEISLSFVPLQLHWTRTNPLLCVRSSLERVNRPAYRFVQAQGFLEIEDWFLPFLCDQFDGNCDRLAFLHDRAKVVKQSLSIFVSARDKGFLWWPTKAALDIVRYKAPPSYSLILAGSEDEKPTWSDAFTTASDVVDGLTLSCAAKLFVGTDTGFATVRELFRLPNIYCVDRYWFEQLMVRYRYWTPEMEATSTSLFAFDEAGLADSLDEFFGNGSRLPWAAGANG
jgi:hypothetical protein